MPPCNPGAVQLGGALCSPMITVSVWEEWEDEHPFGSYFDVATVPGIDLRSYVYSARSGTLCGFLALHSWSTPIFFTCKLVVFEKLAGANWISCCSISEWCRDIGVATQLGFSTLFISQTSSLATMSPDFEQHSGWFDQFDLYRPVSELTEEEAEHWRVLEWLPSSSPTAKTNLRGWA